MAISDYQIRLLWESLIWILFLSATSAFYFTSSNKLSTLKRIGVSAHGAVFSIAILFSILVQEFTTNEDFKIALYSFYALLIIGSLFVIYSLIYYEGKKNVHLLHLPSIAISLVYFLYGSLLIAHDSL